MKHLLIILCIGISALTAKGQYRVVYSSEEVKRPAKQPAIRKIHIPLFSPVIKVIYQDGRKELIAKDTIWGITNKKGRIYRYYKGSFLEVTDIADVIRYTIHEPFFYDNIAVPMVHYAYSQTLTSDIYPTRKKAKRKYQDTGKAIE